MSNINRTNELKEIQQEYSNECARVGDIEHRIRSLKTEISLIHAHLDDLNDKAAELIKNINSQENKKCKTKN